MKVAWLAVGQGMERPGMGRDVAAAWPSAAALLDSVAPGLHGTHVVQPALTAVALGAAAALAEEGVPCHLVAGHSVGELAAWAVAGGVTAPQAVDLARLRGAEMARAARDHPGGMWAVDPSALERPLPAHLVVAVVNPEQVVVSGPEPGLSGAVRVPTSGAWHSPAMASVVSQLTAAVATFPPRMLTMPFVSNHDGRPTIDDAKVRAHLVAQLTHAVRWTAVLATLVELGTTDAVILGPGKVLATHLQRACPGVRVHRTDRASDVRDTASVLR